MLGVGLLVSGIDANGNALSFRAYQTLSRELEEAAGVGGELTEAETAIMDTLARYRQPNERIDDQAYVEISVAENPVRLIRTDAFGNGLGWRYSFSLQEQNGLDFTVDNITIAEYYSETRTNFSNLDPGAIWQTNVIVGKGEPLRFNGGQHVVDDVLGVGVMITGTDEKGNEREFHYFVDLSHEIAE